MLVEFIIFIWVKKTFNVTVFKINHIHLKVLLNF